MPDFRSVGRGTPRLSADLLDVIYTCQTRQSWYREEVLVNGGTPLPFVGSASLGTEPEQAARLIREALHFSTQTRSECVSWSDALRLFIAQAEHFYRTTIARVGKRFAQVQAQRLVVAVGVQGLGPAQHRGQRLHRDPDDVDQRLLGGERDAGDKEQIREARRVEQGEDPIDGHSRQPDASQRRRDQEVPCHDSEVVAVDFRAGVITEGQREQEKADRRRRDDDGTVRREPVREAEDEALLAHPAVAEAAVVGFPHDIKGQGIYAYVTLKQGIEANDDLRKALVQQVRSEIGPTATPDHIQWAPGLPKTRSGKIMRRILRKIAANEHEQLGDISTLADPSVVANLIEERLVR